MLYLLCLGLLALQKSQSLADIFLSNRVGWNFPVSDLIRLSKLLSLFRESTVGVFTNL